MVSGLGLLVTESGARLLDSLESMDKDDSLRCDIDDCDLPGE